MLYIQLAPCWSYLRRHVLVQSTPCCIHTTPCWGLSTLPGCGPIYAMLYTLYAMLGFIMRRYVVVHACCIHSTPCWGLSYSAMLWSMHAVYTLRHAGVYHTALCCGLCMLYTLYAMLGFIYAAMLWSMQYMSCRRQCSQTRDNLRLCAVVQSLPCMLELIYAMLWSM